MTAPIIVTYTATVKNKSAIRNTPSLNGIIVAHGNVFPGELVHITQIKDGEWVFITTNGSGVQINGWTQRSNVTLHGDGEKRFTYISKQDNSAKIQEQTQTPKYETERERQLSMVVDPSHYQERTDSEIIDSLIVNNLNGIYGIPYQFMESVDTRLMRNKNQKTDIGRKYSEKIISKMPLLCITPGRAKFMSNFSKSEKQGIYAALNDILRGDHVESDIDDIISHNGQYFTFDFAYEEYFNHVNALCWTGARFLNIEDLPINVGGNSDTASKFEWQRALNNNLEVAMSSQNFIGFYLDSPDDVQETFTNNTTQSQLSSTINGYSEIAKEMQFILGNYSGDLPDMVDRSKYDDTIEKINEMSKNWSVGKDLFNNIASDFATVAIGGKLLFPEIWQDSEFSRDFDVRIKLRTPDADTVSWYMNIYVPLCHLIALAAGQQLKDTNRYVNGYYSPFLIRAYYKGLFNVDMGIITNMTIRKGKEAAWNIDGLPTEVDVDINIKDLYNMLTIIGDNDPKAFVNNTILMDYIANMCGININQIDLRRSLEIYDILMHNKITDLPNKVYRRFQESIDNTIRNLYDWTMSRLLI